MPKTNKTISLDVQVCEDLRARATAEGTSMSQVIEEALRVRFGTEIPRQESDPDSIDGLTATRNQREVLHVLRKAGPGWHTVVDLKQRGGFSSVSGVVKCLRALERDGKAFFWGPGRGRIETWSLSEIRVGGAYPEGTAYFLGECGECWSHESPLAALERLVASVQADPPLRGKAVEFAMHMALAVADIAPFREACRVAFWPHLSCEPSCVQNFAELEAKVLAEAAVKRAADLAKQEASQAALREKIGAEREAAEHMDRGED